MARLLREKMRSRLGETHIFATSSSQDQFSLVCMPSDRTWSLKAAQQNCSELRNCCQNLLPAPVMSSRRRMLQNIANYKGKLRLWPPDPNFRDTFLPAEKCLQVHPKIA